jgi:hypothetical protein
MLVGQMENGYSEGEKGTNRSEKVECKSMDDYHLKKN